jgi:hypothetical protein
LGEGLGQACLPGFGKPGHQLVSLALNLGETYKPTEPFAHCPAALLPVLQVPEAAEPFKQGPGPCPIPTTSRRSKVGFSYRLFFFSMNRSSIPHWVKADDAWSRRPPLLKMRRVDRIGGEKSPTIMTPFSWQIFPAGWRTHFCKARSRNNR